MPFAFEDTFTRVQANLDVYVDEVFACLESEFLVMPRGPGFVEYSTFASGYEALKRATTGFRDVTPETVAPVVFRLPTGFGELIGDLVENAIEEVLHRAGISRRSIMGLAHLTRPD